MASLSIPALRCGGPAFMPHSQALTAGPLSLLLEDGELRRIRVGEREVVRRIYLTVRGPEWVTIPGKVASLNVESNDEGFRAHFMMMHEKDALDFMWSVSIAGDKNGTLVFEARGVARNDFPVNRVGICVLHPLLECVSQPAIVVGTDGALREGLHFPDSINPHQPFLDFREVSYKVADGWLASVFFEGETFEMEDQRNWSDGSFKTYCPPQDRPKPRQLEAGWQTAQRVTVKLHNPDGRPVPDRPVECASPEARKVDPERPLMIPDLSDKGKAVPAWGFGLPSHGQRHDAADIARIQALHPTHVRADFRLNAPDFRGALARAAEQAQALDLPLEACLVVPENGEALLREFADAFAETDAEALRWILFDEKSDATTDATLDMAREILGPIDPLASFARGSKGDFVLLNRNRPRAMAGQALAYAVSPQVHLTDTRTLVEGLEGQAWTVRTARAEWPGCKPIVTPITLKRSPFSVSLKKPPQPSGAPAGSAAAAEVVAWRNQIDARQFSLFGAGWTLASLKRMAQEGAESATYYETTGLLGLMSGASLPEELLKASTFDFSPGNGWVYPLYHIFADFAEFVGGSAFDLKCDQPMRFQGVMLHAEKRAALLIANLEGTPGKLRLEELGNVGGIRRLNEANALRAMKDPEAWRKEPFAPCAGDAEGWNIDFMPYEIVRLDLAP